MFVAPGDQVVLAERHALLMLYSENCLLAEVSEALGRGVAGGGMEGRKCFLVGDGKIEAWSGVGSADQASTISYSPSWIWMLYMSCLDLNQQISWC